MLDWLGSFVKASFIEDSKAPKEAVIIIPTSKNPALDSTVRQLHADIE